MRATTIFGTLTIATTIWIVLGIANAFADTTTEGYTIRDHYRSVINQQPYTVNICRDVQVSGDRTGDMLSGAIIGGIIGNNITKNLPDGGTAGAIIGGLLGRQGSTASGGTRRECNTETRYTESQEEVYSHSVIAFVNNGKRYKVKFKK
jgi:hypothetical protein